MADEISIRMAKALARTIGVTLWMLCVNSQFAMGQTSADRIRFLRKQSNAAIARHDADAVVAFLDAQYQITVGSGSLFQGKANERKGWLEEFAIASDLRYVRTPESVQVSSSNERAAEVGSWLGTWTTRDGAHRSGGRYAAFWVNDHGSWKIRSELFVTLWCKGTDCETQ